MLTQTKKNFATIMIASYSLMVTGLFLWNWGAILFISIFTFGLPLVGLALPLVGVKMVRAKTNKSLFLSFFCSSLSLIPLYITLTSLPLRTMVDESGQFIATTNGKIIAFLIIASGITFLLTTIVLFLRQYHYLNES